MHISSLEMHIFKLEINLACGFDKLFRHNELFFPTGKAVHGDTSSPSKCRSSTPATSVEHSPSQPFSWLTPV